MCAELIVYQRHEIEHFTNSALYFALYQLYAGSGECSVIVGSIISVDGN